MVSLKKMQKADLSSISMRSLVKRRLQDLGRFLAKLPGKIAAALSDTHLQRCVLAFLWGKTVGWLAENIWVTINAAGGQLAAMGCLVSRGQPKQVQIYYNSCDYQRCFLIRLQFCDRFWRFHFFKITFNTFVSPMYCIFILRKFVIFVFKDFHLLKSYFAP